MKKKILIWLVCILSLAVLVYFGAVAYMHLVDQSQMDETVYHVYSDKLVADVRIVFLTDLHLSEFGENNSQLLHRVRLLHPDLILIGGDMNKRQVDDHSIVLSLCVALQEIAPVYYGLGNHEISRMLSHERQIYNDIVATGVTVLHNTVEEVHVNENIFYIGGVSQAGEEDIGKYSGGVIEKLAQEEGFKLMLSHYPSNYDLIFPHDIDLVLSGHLHGGQVVLPYLDGLYSLDSGFFPKYSQGRFDQEGTTMIVGRGLGNSHRIPRVNNRPELVVVDIYCTTVSYNANHIFSEHDKNVAILTEWLNTLSHEEVEIASNNMLMLMEKQSQISDILTQSLSSTAPPTTTEPPQ